MTPRTVLLPMATALAVLGATASAQASGPVSLERGVLTVSGGVDADRIALTGGHRIRVEVGDAEYAFRRSLVRQVVVEAGDGDDHVRLDDVEAQVEGGEGLDALAVSGTEYDDRIVVKAAGERVRIRGDATASAGTLERLELETLGGDDVLDVRDVTGTPVNDIDAAMGEGHDSVDVHGTPGSDFTDALDGADGLFVFGVPAMVLARDAEDVAVRGDGGDDRLSASSAKPLVLDGGAGDDDLTGGSGDDLLLGGKGTDFVAGGRGADRALLGSDFDIFLWDPGEGSDSVEGGGGSDVMLFRGSGDAERFELSADGRRTRLLRDVGSIAMDFDGMEKVEVGLRAGADRFDVGDLGRTDVSWVVAELASGIAGQSLDQAADAIHVAGTRRADAIAVADTIGGVRVTGLPAMVDVLRPEPALDTLTLATGGGQDTVDTGGLTPGAIGLAVD